jgi:hypothetical protein
MKKVVCLSLTFLSLICITINANALEQNNEQKDILLIQAEPKEAVGLPIENLDSKPITGSIEIIGEEDWFSIQAKEGNEYKIFQLGGIKLAIDVYMLELGVWKKIEEQGYINDWGYTRVTAIADGELKFRLKSHTQTNTGEYQFCVFEVLKDPLLENINGLLDSTPIDGNINPMLEEDWYSFQAEEGNEYKIFQLGGIKLAIDVYMLELGVWEKIEEQGYINDWGYTRVTAIADGELKFRLRSHTLTNTGDYQFCVFEIIKDPLKENITGLLDSTPIDGNINPMLEEDWYSFQAEEGNEYKIFQLGGIKLAIDVYMLELGVWEKIEEQGYINDWGYTRVTAIADGELKFRLRSHTLTNTGDYQFCVFEIIKDPLKENITGLLDSTPIDGNINPMLEEDWYSFQAKEGNEYKILQIDGHNLTIDAYMQEFGVWKKIEEQGYINDWGYTRVTAIADGELKFRLRSHTLTNTGDYLFCVLEILKEPQKVEISSFLDSTPLNGNIDPVLEEDWYSFQAKGGHEYKILQLSGHNLAIDAYMVEFGVWKKIEEQRKINDWGYTRVTAIADGELKFRLRSFTHTDIGDYSFSVLDLNTQVTPTPTSVSLDNTPTPTITPTPIPQTPTPTFTPTPTINYNSLIFVYDDQESSEDLNGSTDFDPLDDRGLGHCLG